MTEGKILFTPGLEFDKKSVDRYRVAAKFMVKVASDCFNIRLPQVVSNCWEDSLELLYYSDHILDNLKSKEERTQFAQYCIECMFADPLDWDFLKFGNLNMDKSLARFRDNYSKLSKTSMNTLDVTLDLFERTEQLKEALTIKNISDARIVEGEKCSELLLNLGNNLEDFNDNERYKKWLKIFWRFGNLADLFIDFGDDIKKGVIQEPDTVQKRLELGKITIIELMKLIKLSNPWLIRNYIRAGKYLFDDKEGIMSDSFQLNELIVNSISI